MNSERRRKELGDFLRTRRSRVSPYEAGLQSSSRRRTPGLRREEVASLSGISLPWYTALEQGRDIQVSEQVLESLVRTLRLSRDERNYLFMLAKANPAVAPIKEVDGSIPPALKQILDRLGTYPAFVVDRRWNVLAWNKTAGTLCGDLEQAKELERNLLWRTFMMEVSKDRIVNWENVSAMLLAHFRNRYAMYINDGWYQDLVCKLHGHSEPFRTWWERHEVAGNSEGDQVLNHPETGLLSFHYNTFMVSESSDYLMRVYTPIENTGTEEKIEALLGAL
ncbi:helix-turn-helix transcriptional regulator [Paenibacillus azoreducens]|uniref:helix-turn-helix transcriptional regulator n=1 Tax=Paenibacillus azoreducens TaxID=116718 RepID=UPI0039F5FF7F